MEQYPQRAAQGPVRSTLSSSSCSGRNVASLQGSASELHMGVGRAARAAEKSLTLGEFEDALSHCDSAISSCGGGRAGAGDGMVGVLGAKLADRLAYVEVQALHELGRGSEAMGALERWYGGGKLAEGAPLMAATLGARAMMGAGEVRAARGLVARAMVQERAARAENHLRGATEAYVDAARVYTVEAVEADAQGVGEAAERWLQSGGDAATGLEEGDRAMLLAEVRALRNPPPPPPPKPQGSSATEAPAAALEDDDVWTGEGCEVDSDLEELAAQEELWASGRVGRVGTGKHRHDHDEDAADGTGTGSSWTWSSKKDAGGLLDDPGVLWAGALGVLAVSVALYNRKALHRAAADAFADVFLGHRSLK